MKQKSIIRSFVLISVGLLIITSLSTIPTAGSEESSDQWSMFGGNTSNDGRVEESEDASDQLKWEFSTNNSILSSPVIDNEGNIYVGSMDGYFYSMSPEGNERWRFNASADIEGSPAIDEEGNIYFGDVNGNFYTLHENGTERWSIDLGEAEILGAPTITEDRTILIANSELLYSLNQDGEIEWEQSLGGYLASTPAVDEEKNQVYLGMGIMGVGQIHAIDLEEGETEWSFTVDEGGIYSSPALDEDGNVYFGSFDGNLYSFYSNGTKRWNFETGNLFELPLEPYEEYLEEGSVPSELREQFEDEGFELFEHAELQKDGDDWIIGEDFIIETSNTSLEILSAQTEIFTSPAISEGRTVYVGSNSDQLYAVNQSGEKEWSYTSGGSIHSSPLVDADGNIYFGSQDGNMYSLDSEGGERWFFETDDWILSSPAMNCDGNLYFGSSDDNFYSLREVEEYEITFEVQDEDGEPIEGTDVTVDEDTLETDEEGEAVFEDIEPDTYEFTVEQEGYGTVEDNVTIEYEEITESVTLEEEEDDIPGFTLVLLILGMIITIAIYRGKKEPC